MDIISIAYSHQLGLIATADCKGCVVVLDYVYLSLECCIKDFVGTEVAQVTFLDPYPLLCISDHYHNFTIIPVGPAAKPGMPRVMFSVATIARAPVANVSTKKSFMETLGLEEGGVPSADNSLGGKML